MSGPMIDSHDDGALEAALAGLHDPGQQRLVEVARVHPQQTRAYAKGLGAAGTNTTPT